MTPRLNFLYCFIGTMRTGKSSIARVHTIAWKKANPGKIVVGFDPQGRFHDLIDIFISPSDPEWALKLYKSCRKNYLLILDDMRIINKHWSAAKGLDDLMYFRCHWNIDIITIFHNPKKVLDVVSNYATHYFVFKTNAVDGSFQDKIPNYMQCEVASEQVNQFVAKYGLGNWKDGKGNIVNNFPHIVVDNENLKLIAFNMNSKY